LFDSGDKFFCPFGEDLAGASHATFGNVQQVGGFGLRCDIGKFAGLTLAVFQVRNLRRHHCPLAFAQVPTVQIQRHHECHQTSAGSAAQ
jgi:hypothetical protein